MARKRRRRARQRLQAQPTAALDDCDRGRRRSHCPLRPHMPAPLTWVALNGLAGVVITYVESPIRILLFAPAEAAAGLAGAEGGGGAARGGVFGGVTAPPGGRHGAAGERPGGGLAARGGAK